MGGTEDGARGRAARPDGTDYVSPRPPRRRLPPEIFELPVEKMREGYYTDAYFNHARSTLFEDERRPRVVMQVFQKNDAHLGGMDEAIAILKLCSEEWDDLNVQALYDGDRIDPYESVMTIEGDYTSFAHLETLYLGVLARRTLITTYGGNTVLAATKFADWAPDDLNVVVLVDFENDSVATALEVARALGPRLWGVRLDTSESLVDRSLWDELGDFEPTGVNERLVRKVRDALDRDGFERIKIVVSGGFTAEKIREFEEQGVPVDSYGVGSSLIRGSNASTADVVLTDGRPSAKAGRRFRSNPRLELVE